MGSPSVGSALPDPSPPVPQAGECSDTFSTFDVPIFTEEFLDQNKGEGLGCGVGGAGAAASDAAAGAACVPRGRTMALGGDPGSEGSLVRLGRGAGSWLEPGGW